nr:integrase, catalytic region, zinc finger, CCHC-type, peptidase aspartic, catalytic [Tanacetum cinerariifolium]
MESMITLRQKNTLAEYMILSSADNRPPMLNKDLYDSWKSRMELYMQNREHKIMILESVEHDPLIELTIAKNGVIKTKKYAELSAAEKIHADCDMKATNIILQGLPSDIYSLVNRHRVANDLRHNSTTYARQGLLNVTTVKVKDIWLGNALSLRDQGMQHDPGVPDGQLVQTMLLFRLRNLILLILTVMISQMKKRFSWPTFLTMVLMLSQSKPFDALPTKIEAATELPKISLVNESLKSLKFHLAKFNNVVKIRTTPNARTEDVQTVFDQIDAAVQQSLIDKQCLEIAKKELLLENDRILQQIMSQDVLLTVLNSMSLIGDTVNKDGNRKESCNLEAELLKSQNAFNDLLKVTHNLENIVFLLNAQYNLIKKFFKNNKRKEIVDITAQKPSANTIVPGIFKLDLEPLAPSAKKVAVTPKNKVKKVRFAEPLTYSSNIKQVDSSNTTDSNTHVLSPTRLKYSNSNCGSNPSGNKKNDRISQTPSRNMKNKIEAQPMNVNKKNRIVKPIRNVDVKQSQLNANFELICATCKKSMFDGVHDLCILDFVKNIFLWYLDSECSKHMTGNRSQLMNFVSKFLGTIRFGNDHITRIMSSSSPSNLLLVFVCIIVEVITLSCGIKSPAGSENRPLMLNKENYVPWSSRLLWYAKSRPNGMLIHNSIINGPYVKRMIPEPGDPNREVHVNETFHVQIYDELTEKELKQIEAGDQAIQTILLGLPEDIYTAVDSYETA